MKLNQRCLAAFLAGSILSNSFSVFPNTVDNTETTAVEEIESAQTTASETAPSVIIAVEKSEDQITQDTLLVETDPVIIKPMDANTESGDSSIISLVEKIEVILENVQINLANSEGSEAASAQTAVTRYITDLLEGTNVSAIIEGTNFTAPTPGTSENPTGTHGTYEFVVALIDGEITATTNKITANIDAAPYVASEVVDPTPVVSVPIPEPDNTALLAVVDILDNAIFTLDTADASSIEDAKVAISSDVAYILSDTEMTAEIKGYGFVTAIDGSAAVPLGTDGYYKFVIEVTDGENTASTDLITSTIDALDVTIPEQSELDAFIQTIEATNFAKSDITTATDAGLAVKAELENILKDTNIHATIKAFEFTAPVNGSPTNQAGTDGEYKFAIELANGHATASTQVQTLTLHANEYDVPVVLQNLVIKGLTHSDLEFNDDMYNYTLNIAQADQGKNFIINPIVEDGLTATVSVPNAIKDHVGITPITADTLIANNTILINVTIGDKITTYTINVEIADNSLLAEPILEAQELILVPTVSIDGSDVASDATWVSSNAQYAYSLAIEKANELLLDEKLTSSEIETAVANLAAATDTFKAEIAAGTQFSALEILNISVAGNVTYDAATNQINVLDTDTDEFTITVVAKNSDVALISSVSDTLSTNGILTFTVPTNIDNFNIMLASGDLTSKPISFTVNSTPIDNNTEEPVSVEPEEEPTITDAQLLAALAAMGVKYNVTLIPVTEEEAPLAGEDAVQVPANKITIIETETISQ